MKAIGINEYGSYNNLKLFDIKQEDLKPKDVLIQVKAISVNPFDTKLRKGLKPRYPNQNRPLILGLDFAGEILELGSEVTEFEVGQRIIGATSAKNQGTYREKIVVSKNKIVLIPDPVSYQEAATLKTAGITAYQSLFTKGNLKESETVLIHAGAGGVGHIAIQLAKIKGAKVIATASTKNHEFLKSLGADEVYDYKDPSFYDALEPIDLVVDSIGGQTQLASLKVLSLSGRLVSLIENSNPQDSKIIYFSASYQNEIIQELCDLIHQGKLKIHISQTFDFTLENMKEAHRLLEEGHTVGKIVLTF